MAATLLPARRPRYDAMSARALLEMRGISKSFPGVPALMEVDFTLHAGEIHALMGENGAGKSTLIKVLTGVERPDVGTMHLDGVEIHPHTPHEAQLLGISTVYQEINLCPNLSVAENILLGREPRSLTGIHWKRLFARAQETLARLEVDIDVGATLAAYSVAVQQMVAIARALEVQARVLILDEPTSSLSSNETEKLFDVLRKLKSEGLGIVFITHFLDQVYAIADRITVLRNGRLVGSYKADDLQRYQLVERMIGRELEELEALERTKDEAASHRTHEPVLRARALERDGSIAPFDLDLYAGEVLGVAGLLGSGRTETANLLFGVDKADGGTLNIGGEDVAHPTPLGSIKRAVAFCPEDRRAMGIVGDLTVRENIVLAMQASRGWLRYVGRKKQEELANRMIELLQISTPSPEQLVKNLSGGNQQKVILARWLATEPRLLILDEPTRGIDVGTKAEIQKMVLAFAREGKAVMFISSELDEVLRTSHRVIVLSDGALVSELAGDDVSEPVIMQTLVGGSA
jgi:galactofuranose transport system ATP-binding protein